MDFNITLWGSRLVGKEVSHNLKSLWTSFLLIYSYIDSNSGINDKATWQFYNKIHLPYYIANLINFNANITYPYPNDN